MEADAAPDPDKERFPVVWTRTYNAADGSPARVVTTTHGASEDFVNDGFRRLLVNAALWAAGFIAVGHQYERWMIPIRVHDSFRFIVQPLIDWFSLTDRGPRTTFDLKIESALVGGHECRFRWAPRVKPNMVQPVGLTDANDSFPRTDISWRVSGQGKDAAFERPSKKQLNS